MFIKMSNNYTIDERKKLVKNIENLPKEFQLEIYYYIYSNVEPCDYTQNTNGLFININNMDEKLIHGLTQKVYFYKENEKKLIDSSYKNKFT